VSAMKDYILGIYPHPKDVLIKINSVKPATAQHVTKLFTLCV
jgi:hypothetical protein